MLTADQSEKLLSIVPGIFKEWRPNQMEVIDKILTSPKKFIVIQAPTGFGKSASIIGSMVCSPGRNIVVTQTKQLGEQYYSDFNPNLGLATVKGRNNFICAIKPDRTVDLAPCAAGYQCRYKRVDGCDYYEQKRIAISSNLVAMNIFYFLFEANYTQDFSNIKLLCIDEAHKLESSLLQFVEVRLNKRRFKREGYTLPLSPTFASINKWTKEVVPQLTETYTELVESLSLDPQNVLAIDKGISIKGLLDLCSRYIQLSDNTWIIEEDDNNVICKPVWTKKYTEPFIFKHTDKVILVSATLPRKALAALGIDDYEYINIPSGFTPVLRPIIWIPAANLARSAENPLMEMKKLIASVDAIIAKFPKKKGIIHTTNYKITQEVITQSKYKSRMFFHSTSKERQTALDNFKLSSDGILVSPSFTEGIDLPYDGCRWQIICKLPYQDLSDKQTKARLEADPEWYATAAITTLVQAYGRIMRAPDDSGVTYILDTGLLSAIKRWRSVFNQMDWFMEALYVSEGKTIRPISEILGTVKIEDE